MGIRTRTGKRPTGSGSFAAAGVLALAAAPTFAAMALWTGLADPPGMICTSNPGGIDGMAIMYALMSVFHLSPWLRLASGES
jgi:hypothetical protein